MTNEQINKMAAEALGICFEHSWFNEASSGLVLCEICKRSKHLESSFPDFCDDLNAAQRLVKKVGGKGWAMTDKRHAFEVAIEDLSEGRFYFYFLLPAKTITLACLAALGKITLAEARESL